MKTSRTLLSGLVAGALAATLTATPADAQTRRLHDKRGDAPRGSDIRAVKVTHARQRVKVRIRMTEIGRDAHGVLRPVGVYFDSKRRRRGPELYIGVSGGFDVYRLKHGKPWFEGDPNQRCYRGADANLEERKEVAIIVAHHMRRCLGRPKAVRVRVKTTFYRRSGPARHDYAPDGRKFTRPVRRG